MNDHSKLVSEFAGCPTAGVFVQQPAAWGVQGFIELTRDGLHIRYLTRDELNALEAARLVDQFGNRTVRPDQFAVRWDIHNYTLRSSRPHLAVFDAPEDAIAFAERVEPGVCETRSAVTVTDGTGKVVHVRKHPMDALTH